MYSYKAENLINKDFISAFETKKKRQIPQGFLAIQMLNASAASNLDHAKNLLLYVEKFAHILPLIASNRDTYTFLLEAYMSSSLIILTTTNTISYNDIKICANCLQFAKHYFTSIIENNKTLELLYKRLLIKENNNRIRFSLHQGFVFGLTPFIHEDSEGKQAVELKKISDFHSIMCKFDIEHKSILEKNVKNTIATTDIDNHLNAINQHIKTAISIYNNDIISDLKHRISYKKFIISFLKLYETKAATLDLLLSNKNLSSKIKSKEDYFSEITSSILHIYKLRQSKMVLPLTKKYVYVYQKEAGYSQGGVLVTDNVHDCNVVIAHYPDEKFAFMAHIDKSTDCEKSLCEKIETFMNIVDPNGAARLKFIVISGTINTSNVELQNKINDIINGKPLPKNDRDAASINTTIEIFRTLYSIYDTTNSKTIKNNLGECKIKFEPYITRFRSSVIAFDTNLGKFNNFNVYSPEKLYKLTLPHGILQSKFLCKNKNITLSNNGKNYLPYILNPLQLQKIKSLIVSHKNKTDEFNKTPITTLWGHFRKNKIALYTNTISNIHKLNANVEKHITYYNKVLIAFSKNKYYFIFNFNNKCKIIPITDNNWLKRLRTLKFPEQALRTKDEKLITDVFLAIENKGFVNEINFRRFIEENDGNQNFNQCANIIGLTRVTDVIKNTFKLIFTKCNQECTPKRVALVFDRIKEFHVMHPLHDKFSYNNIVTLNVKHISNISNIIKNTLQIN